jgi:adenosine kinase
MSFSHENSIADATTATLGIVAPDGRDGMQKHARDFAAAGIPFLFDPGQGLPMFSGDDLLEFMRLADYACFNDYEAQLLCDRTGRTLDELALEVRALIVTRGGSGSEIRTNGQLIEIPCVKADQVVDPTGCGDAYRSGLLYGIAAGWELEKAGKLASLMGSIKIAERGGQNHRPGCDEIAARYGAAFGEVLW